eukprot:374163-Pelagomonas_calceolata.AAC.1
MIHRQALAHWQVANEPPELASFSYPLFLTSALQVVIKPAELTPLSAVALAELAERAGLPDGVLNVSAYRSAHRVSVERGCKQSSGACCLKFGYAVTGSV